MAAGSWTDVYVELLLNIVLEYKDKKTQDETQIGSFLKSPFWSFYK